MGGASTIVHTIGTDGKVRDITVEHADDQRYANHAAIALKGWTFQPASKAGVLVEARLRQTFKFEQ